jgi:hypothetical protein
MRLLIIDYYLLLFHTYICINPGSVQVVPRRNLARLCDSLAAFFWVAPHSLLLCNYGPSPELSSCDSNMDPLDFLEKAFSVGKWIYDQLNTMQENKADAQALASRVLRLAGVLNFLKTQVKQKPGGSSQLSAPVQACLSHVEDFFAELEGMLRAHNGATYSAGFFGKAKAFVAKAKEFFGAENWRDQLSAANSKLSEVLGDLEAAITAQGLVINIETAAVVQGLMSEVRREHSDVLEMKGMMQHMQKLLERGPSSPSAAPRDGSSIPCYNASDITIVRKIGEGGNSTVYLARYPHAVKDVVYKKCVFLSHSIILFFSTVLLHSSSFLSDASFSESARPSTDIRSCARPEG